jgi:hypothetical protein
MSGTDWGAGDWGLGRERWVAPIGERAEFDGLGDFNAEFD